MPSGWFRIATSDQLPSGGVGVFEINGQEVVAFRDEQGAVTVVDPICPHMGAHLGYGGRVVDGALRCPFHGLRFDTNGWTKPLTKVLPLKGHIQDIAENSVDFGHFAAVHEYSDLQDPTLRIDGPRLYSKFAFTRKNPFFPMSDVQSIFDTDIHGLGLSVTDLRVPMETPALIPGDGPIAKFRRWVKQFYA
jgi:phenylpropionate dioxygenase-like ring-hydroxylating dioxygenase large terminal subunit